MRKIWQDDAWEDYLYWQTQDKKTLKKINRLLKDIDRNGYRCTGKPEPLYLKPLFASKHVLYSIIRI